MRRISMGDLEKIEEFAEDLGFECKSRSTGLTIEYNGQQGFIEILYDETSNGANLSYNWKFEGKKATNGKLLAASEEICQAFKDVEKIIGKFEKASAIKARRS